MRFQKKKKRKNAPPDVSVSRLSDRSVILLGGQKADGAQYSVLSARIFRLLFE